MTLLRILFILSLLSVVVTEGNIEGEFSSRSYLPSKGLELLHVLVRHGARTPDSSYPNDPHANETYYPDGLGQLTNEGEMTGYKVGLALRRQYGNFLGDVYYPQTMEAASSPVARCQSTLQTVLAGLYPPRGPTIWNNRLNWQPIPYVMIPPEYNKILLSIVSCPSFFRNYIAYMESGGIDQDYPEYNVIMDYVVEHSGVPLTSGNPFGTNLALYGTLRSQEEWGLALPSWTESIWPETMAEVSARMTALLFTVEGNRAIGAGFFMSKIINDTYSMINEDPRVQGRKLYLYSGHEVNIIAILSWLGVIKPHNPEYGAYLAIEVHNFLGRRFLKILYENYEAASPVPVYIPGCGVYCPIERFEKLFEELLNPYALCN